MDNLKNEAHPCSPKLEERSSPERTEWAYVTTEILESKLENTLNEWGERGWELVALTALPPIPEKLYGAHLFLAVFKMPDI
jgi:hypothetical protein